MSFFKVFCVIIFLFFQLIYASQKDPINISDYEYPLPPLENDNIQHIAILGTNDIHGAFFPQYINDTSVNISYSYGGMEILGKYISIMRNEWKDKFLWLDGGDIFQGGLETKQSNGDIMTDFFNIMGVNASTIGNHEWDFGQNFIKRQMNRSQFPYLVSNIQNTTTNETIFLPNQIKSKIFEIGEIKLGVIGVTTITTPETTGGNLTSVKFLAYADIIIKEANELRKKTNAVILLAHVGMKCLNDGEAKLNLEIRTKYSKQKNCEDYDEMYILLNTLPKHTVDAVVAAHKHDVTHHWINGTPVISSLNNGVYANIFYLPFDKSQNYKLIRKDIKIEGPLPVCEKVFTSTRRCTPYSSKELADKGELVKFTFHDVIVEKEKKVQKLSSIYWPKYYDYLNSYITKTNDVWKVSKNFETSLGNLVCDIVKRRTRADVSILGAGTFRNTWNPGNISRANLYGMIPFDSKVVTFEMTGEEMKKMLFQIQSGQYSFYPTSGLKMVVTRKPRKQLLSVQLFNGLKEKEVINTATYTIATLDYDILLGGDDFKKVVQWYQPRNVKIYDILRDVVSDYLIQMNSIHHYQFFSQNKQRLTVITKNSILIVNDKTKKEKSSNKLKH